MKTIYLVQLPFPSLDYFPVPNYFAAMQNWMRTKVSASITIPRAGLWEVPPWITSLRTHLCCIREESSTDFAIKVIDLSSLPYQYEIVIEHLGDVSAGNIAFFSPLTQNYQLTSKISTALAAQGVQVGIGGATTYLYNDQPAISIFQGRIESSPQKFANWLCSEFGFTDLSYKNYPEAYARQVDMSWASSYQGQVIYNRVFTHHGCPFKCGFCADRLTELSTVPAAVLRAELLEIVSIFPDQDTIYVGDLTFGVSKSGLRNILEVTKNDPRLSHLKFIVRTNLSLITSEFVRTLQSLNVVMVEIGVETANAAAAIRVQKSKAGRHELEDRVTLLQESNIQVSLNFIFGLPSEVHENYEETLAFIEKWKDTIWFNIYGLVPYHNTPIYTELASSGRIITENFDNWCEGGDLVFEPFFVARNEVRKYLTQALNLAISR